MFHITIGSEDKLPPSLENDLRMVKAAILYADKVKLCSIGYSTWMPKLVSKNITIEQLLAQEYKLREMIPFMFSDPNEIKYNLWVSDKSINALQSKNPSMEDLRYREEAKQIAFQQYENLKNKFPTLNLEKTNEEFEKAIKADLLEIHTFKFNETENLGASNLKGTLQESYRKITEEFLQVIYEMIAHNSTYPLFDDEVGSIVNFGINVGAITPTQTRVAQAKQSKLAAEVLRRLPVFDEASISEVLDVRKELERHLIRFRSKIIEYSEKIRNESWSKEFSVEAEETFRREIEPAVLDIEDAVKSNNSLFTLLTRKFVDKSTSATVGASAISFFVSQLNLLPTITATALSTAATFGLNAAVAVHDAYKETQKQQEELEKNQLYFYYKAGKMLNK